MARRLVLHAAPVLLGFVAFVVVMSRGADLLPWGDEFGFVVHRPDLSADSLLNPHNEHLVVCAVLAYKALLAVGGFEHYWVTRAFAAGVHLLVVGLVFALVRRRLGAALALALCIPVLLMGPGAENVLNPFQITFTLPLAGGLAAILVLDSEDARRDGLACAALVVAVGSSGVGLPFLVAVAVMLGLRRAWRRLWVVAVPVALWGAWRVTRDVEQQLAWQRLDDVPPQLAAYASDAAGAIAGLGPKAGAALALAALVLVVAAFRRRGRGASRLAAYVVFATTLWTLLILSRSADELSTSRYRYVGGILVLLAVAEALPRPHPRHHRTAVAIAATCGGLAAVAGLADFRAEAARLADFSSKFQGQMRALEMSRALVDPERVVVTGLSPPFTGAQYFRVVEAYGSAALTEAQIDRADRAVGALADRLLIELQRVRATPGSARGRAGARPRPSATTARAPTRPPGCVTVSPAGPAAPEVGFGPPGLRVVASGGAAVEVRIWRLARGLPIERIATVPPRGAVEIRVPADASPRPWKAALLASPSATVCGLR